MKVFASDHLKKIVIDIFYHVKTARVCNLLSKGTYTGANSTPRTFIDFENRPPSSDRVAVDVVVGVVEISPVMVERQEKKRQKVKKKVFKEFCLILQILQNRNVFFCIMYSNSVSHKKKVSVSFVYLIKGQFFNNFKTRFTSLIYKDSCNFSLLFISSRT